jgi:hypothetical protein
VREKGLGAENSSESVGAESRRPQLETVYDDYLGEEKAKPKLARVSASGQSRRSISIATPEGRLRPLSQRPTHPYTNPSLWPISSCDSPLFFLKARIAAGSAAESIATCFSALAHSCSPAQSGRPVARSMVSIGGDSRSAKKSLTHASGSATVSCCGPASWPGSRSGPEGRVNKASSCSVVGVRIRSAFIGVYPPFRVRDRAPIRTAGGPVSCFGISIAMPPF